VPAIEEQPAQSREIDQSRQDGAPKLR
jgi:hypothetical protein